MHPYRITLALVLVVSLAACGGSGDSNAPLPAVASVTVSPSSPSLTVGESVTLLATPLDGSDKQQITFGTDIYDDMPSWSPDGQSIVYVRIGSAIFGDLYVVDWTGGTGRSLMQFIGPLAGPQLEPSWSPDGKLIAFASSHADQQFQIYTVWADGTRVVRRTSDPSHHSSAGWITD